MKSTTLVLAFAALFAVLAAWTAAGQLATARGVSSSSSPSLGVLWKKTLPVSTVLAKEASTYAALFDVSASKKLYAVTTTDGTLRAFDAETGAHEWTWTGGSGQNTSAFARKVVGCTKGVFVLEGNNIYGVDATTGNTTFVSAAPPFLQLSSTSLSLVRQTNTSMAGGFAYTLILFDGKYLTGASTDNGRVEWSIGGLFNIYHFLFTGIRLDAAGDSGHVAVIRNFSATNVSSVLVVDAASGKTVYEKEVRDVTTTFLYIAAVDRISVLYINHATTGEELVCRHFFRSISTLISYCLKVVPKGSSDNIFGYGVSKRAGGEGSFTQLYLNTQHDTRCYNYTSGAPVGSVVRKDPDQISYWHIVALADYAMVSYAVNTTQGTAVRIVGYTFAEGTMPLRYNFTFPGGVEYGATSENWNNEVLYPNPRKGFYFIFGAPGKLDSSYAKAFSANGGIVSANTVLTSTRAFVTSGHEILVLSFPNSK